MWSRRNLLAGIAGALATGTLGGCGFRPLYGRSGVGADLSDTLSQVEIGPVRNTTTDGRDLSRLGQQLHNALLDGLSPRGPRGEQIYRLDVTLNEGIASLAVQKRADATRQGHPSVGRRHPPQDRDLPENQPRQAVIPAPARSRTLKVSS